MTDNHTRAAIRSCGRALASAGSSHSGSRARLPLAVSHHATSTASEVSPDATLLALGALWASNGQRRAEIEALPRSSVERKAISAMDEVIRRRLLALAPRTLEGLEMQAKASGRNYAS